MRDCCIAKKVILYIKCAIIKKKTSSTSTKHQQEHRDQEKHIKAELVYYSFTFKLLFDIEKDKNRHSPKFDGPFTKTSFY